MTDVVVTEQAVIEQAISDQVVIEQAKGIIMGGRGCTGDEAFIRLSDVAVRSGRPLREIAQNLVDTVSAQRRPPRAED